MWVIVAPKADITHILTFVNRLTYGESRLTNETSVTIVTIKVTNKAVWITFT